MANKIVIYQDMTPRAKKAFRLADVFPSIDGCRTRLSSLCFDTYAEAHNAVMELEKVGGAYHGD